MTRALLCFALAATPALAGMPKTLAEKVHGADLVLEFELKFDAEAMATYDKNGANAVYPGGPVKAALEKARVVRTIFPAKPPDDPPKLQHVAGASQACIDAAGLRVKVRALGFFKRDKKGHWQQIFGVEQMLPLHTDLDPKYQQVVAAVQEAVKWRAAPETAEASLQSDNPILRRLAAGWLQKNGNRSAVDNGWGRPGTPERQLNERNAPEQRAGACE